MLQKKVNQKLAFGVPGDLAFADVPRVIDPKTVSAGAICNYFTVDVNDPSKAVLGGNGSLGGIAINSKEYAIAGLGASLAFVPGAIAQIMSKGRVYMQIDAAVTVGMAAFYNTTTGVITAAASGTEMEGFKEIPNSEFVEVNALANEISVLQLN